MSSRADLLPASLIGAAIVAATVLDWIALH